MKKLFTTSIILFFTIQLFSQTITIVNNQPNSVLIELGWNDNTVPPMCSSFKPHVPDFQCVMSGVTMTVTPTMPNWDILKGFKVYCAMLGCTAAQSYTDFGPWSGDPGVAPIWHMGFTSPTGSIDHFDCGSGTFLGTVDWNYVSTGCPFPFGDFIITIN